METPVRAYYERMAEQEWQRLERPDEGALEWALTCRALAELSISDPASYHATLDMIARTANDPSILGLANHLLFIGRRPR